MVAPDDILRRLRGSDPRTLPRLATLIENEDPRGLDALDALFPLTGNAHIVGVTGPPGSGKSTLVAAMIEHIRSSDRRVAVLAIDPSSPITGGAVLGDRIRMMGRYADESVFIRSMASRGRQGGLAWATAELVHLLDAAGFPLILVETVGTGQDGIDIASLADTVVVVETPGLGDGVQAIKSGLLEIGDIVVVNKADQPGAEAAQRLIRAEFASGDHASARPTPVLPTVAVSGDGVPNLMKAIDDHMTWLNDTGQRSARRERCARSEVLAGLRAALDRQIAEVPGRSTRLSNAIARVANRQLTPRRAVESLAAPLLSTGGP